ncbi:ecbeb8a4-1890-44c6-a640-9e664e630471 [Thermothielavioides terrestris]|nr:ecbeb8a4-1890-44c6-a640-9e664e630471 [Thermothielavioides terrestris]
MRPSLLPPLVIPQRFSAAPILLASHDQQQVVDQRISQYRSSFPRSQAEAKPEPPLPPPPPPPVAALPLDDLDNVDLFNFYHPCLLPPTPIQPRQASHAFVNRDPAELPADAVVPASRLPRGLSRYKYTASRRGRGSFRRRNLDGLTRPQRPPLSPLASSPSPQPRRVSLPKWEGCESGDAMPTPGAGEDDAAGEDNVLVGSVNRACDAPSLDYCDDSGSEYGDYSVGECGSPNWESEEERVALRELWDVIDDLLPGGNVLDHADIQELVNAGETGSDAGGWNDVARRSDDGSVDSGYGAAPQDTAWWRDFRQRLLLSQGDTLLSTLEA